MKTTIIFIRHASIFYTDNRDTITESGEKYSYGLAKLLESHGYQIDTLFYVNKDKSNRKINRCYNTIKNIPCTPIYRKYNNFSIDCLNDYNNKVVAVCYIKQSIKTFITNGVNYFQDIDTDILYENIIIMEYDGNKFDFIGNINTSDQKNYK